MIGDAVTMMVGIGRVLEATARAELSGCDEGSAPAITGMNARKLALAHAIDIRDMKFSEARVSSDCAVTRDTDTLGQCEASLRKAEAQFIRS